MFLIIMICSSIYRPNTSKKDYDWVEITQTKKSADKNENKKYYEQWLEPLDSVREMPEFDRFIYTRTMNGGLGNQMYRFASLYAMGKLLNRTPVYVHDESTMHQIDKELAYAFPNFHSKIYFLRKNVTDIHTSAFAKECCDYNDPKILLSQNKGRALMLTGEPVFENTRYFNHMRPQILKIFEFGKGLVSKVAAIKEKIISEDKSHKICIHTRVGDFTGMGESKTGEINKALVRIIKILTRLLKNKTYSLVLFGTDKGFLKTIKTEEPISKVQYVSDLNLSRGEELNFAQQICDSFLDSADLSSFAAWMGYLMPEDRPIFFIRRYRKGSLINSLSMLPESWIPIDESWLKN
uniref:Uncharacterized protein n=1 Tax=Meloidogyne enterolobii TaxID=390850 RepID=A0A6V7WAW9_MELEN|nr:unnamed protein product [Meloidogyne enterolobii]